jgi:dTDP-4-dehydrorhamnose reductase
MTRILITGGSSYLGQHLVPLAQGVHEVCYTFFSQDVLGLRGGVWLDVREATAVAHLVTQFQPEVIIHTVGSNRGADMRQVIEAGTQHITAAAATVQARLIHLSTDSIFNGRTDAIPPPPYNESAPPSPVNEYGRAKAHAENIIRQYPHHVIIRTSLIYGLQKMDHGTTWMAQALQNNQPVTLFSNQLRNPIWVQSLSHACLELANHPYTGTLNIAGQQPLSRANFSLRMLDYWHIQPRHTLTIAPSQSQQWPLDCRLELHLAQKILQTPLPGVDDVLTKAKSQPTGTFTPF